MTRKELEDRVVQLKDKIDKLDIQNQNVLESLQKRKKELYDTQQILKNLDDKEEEGVTFSDHAILRYLERQLGVDIEAIKNSVKLDLTNKSLLRKGIKVSHGHGYFVLEGKKIVTFVVKTDDKY